MNLLNNIPNFLSPVIARGASVVSAITANVPTPIVQAISKFANIVFSQYGAVAVGAFATYHLVRKHVSLPTRTNVDTELRKQDSKGNIIDQKIGSESRSSIRLTTHKFDLKSLAAVAAIIASTVFILKK